MLKHLIEEAFELVYPVCCIECGRARHHLCPACFGRLLLDSAYERDHAWIAYPVPGTISAHSAAVYGGTVREMVLKLKSSARQFSSILALLMIAAAGNDPDFTCCDAVVPVPSTRRALSERGYNPAALLARECAGILGRPHVEALRKRDGGTRQHDVGRDARWENMREAVSVIGGEEVGAKRVLLIDDVLTTGATAGACANALLRAGAASVSLLTCARAPLDGR